VKLWEHFNQIFAISRLLFETLLLLNIFSWLWKKCWVSD